MKRTSLWLAIIVGLQVAWLAGTAISKEISLKRGTTVLLETAPVDPRDFLRGDYVILSYKISSVPVEWIKEPYTPGTLHGREIYVTLEERGKFYEATAASLTAVTAPRGGYVVRGTIDEPEWARGAANLRIHYGIERYYVRERTGNPRGKLTALCVVNADQTLLIKEVFVDGQPYAIAARKAL